MSSKTLKDAIALLLKRSKISPLTLGDIIELLAGKGKALVVLLLSLPFCQPIQIPGSSIPFGIVIAFMGIRMSFGKRVWLPKKILSKKIPPEKLKKIATKMLSLMRKIHPFIHRRLDWICRPRMMTIMHGLTIVFLGLILALPLPIPLSNIVAGWSLLLICLGILEEDGLLIILGYLMTLFTLIFILFMIFQLKGYF